MGKTILSPWDRFTRLLALERKDIMQIFYYAVFSGIVTLSLPLGIQAIINLIQGAQISTSWIVLVLLVTVGVIFTGVLQLMQLRIIETLQQRIFTRASFEFSYRFPKMSMRELRNKYPPELANRFFDTLTIQKGLAKILIDVPSAVLQIVFALIILSFYHSFFILFGFLLVVLLYLVFLYTAEKGMRTSLEESKHKYRIAHWIQEVARSTISFKLSGRTTLALDKNDHLVSDYLVARESHFQVIKLQFMKMIGFKVIVTTGLLVIGGVLVLNQQMNIGQFVAAEIIILLVINSVEKLILGLETIYDMLTSIEKLGRVVDMELEPENVDKPNFDDEFSIEVDNVSYLSLDGKKQILSDLSLSINNESRILIRGESGSGKSSLLQAVLGLVNPISGNVYVNNRSIHSINISHYRSHIGLCLSEEVPFEGTLKENLTFGDNSISEDRILEAIKSVQLLDFLKDQPNGIQTHIYPEGRQIPYTVAKKIVLARAILKSPKLLILENTFDSFEREEANMIIDYLCKEEHSWGLLVVSTRKYWEEHCDEVVNMENGKTVIV